MYLIFQSIFKRYFLTLLTLSLVACGGGGDNGSSTNNDSLNQTNITLSQDSISLVQDSNHLSISKKIIITYKGSDLKISQPNPPLTTKENWLQFRLPKTQNGKEVEIEVYAANTDLSPGRYKRVLRFSTSNADGSGEVYRDVAVSYTITHTVSTNALEFNYVDGNTVLPTPKTLTISAENISLNLTANKTWIKFNETLGTGDKTISVSVDPTGIAIGNYEGTVNVSDPVTGLSKLVVISMSIEDHRLFVPRNGVALTSVPGALHLSDSIRIMDNGGIPTRWTASSNQTWLILVTTNGMTDGMLEFTAVTSSLVPGMHYASITISQANEPSIVNTQIVKVGLYISSTVPTALISNKPFTKSKYYFSLVSDPIRPLVYVTQNDISVEVYNTYSGMLVKSYNISGTTLSGLTIASDGSYLYVVDEINESIIPINLKSKTVETAWTGIQINRQLNLAYARPNGIPVLITSDDQMLSSVDGTVLTTFGRGSGGLLNEPSLAVNPCGTSLFMETKTSGNHSLLRYSLTNRNNTPRVVLTHEISEIGKGKDIAMKGDCTTLYSVSDFRPAIIAYNESDLSVNSSLIFDNVAISNIEVDWQGKVYASSINSPVPTNTKPNVLLFQPKSTMLSSSLYVPGDIRSNNLVLSGDGSRLIILVFNRNNFPILTFLGLTQ